MAWKDPVERFLDLLRLRTVSAEGPSGSYNECAQWLREYLEELNLPVQVFSPVENKPIVLATWEGEDPTLPGIILNSHYDVVPAMAEHWQYDPFDAKVLADGRIYGRGAQDMKCVCIQYVEAVHTLMSSGFKPKRNIYLLFVPDEEIGGAEGMANFLETEQFKTIMPVAFAFDEGLANPGDAFTVFYGERSPWWVYVKAEGRPSGVSQDGGKTHALNVIPTEAITGFDIRVSPGMDMEAMKAKLDEWCAAEGVSWEFAPWTDPLHDHYVTSLDADNVWWQLFQKACAQIGETLETEIFPAATDSRFLRKVGVPAIGFSPMKRTEILLHEHNECLSKDTFLHGISVYVSVFQEMFAYK
ncbi:T-complex protein 11 protein 2 [Phytophthora nicotianae]|uniref:T-complex protein 11 protein 2 n=1 Tax=Phytophthora nicotianae TaxID=4792 RepID=A0A0W8D9F9_PHYNI|nr:T-complex protein 11 protein 2 [Phytophthora nicotianae]